MFDTTAGARNPATTKGNTMAINHRITVDPKPDSDGLIVWRCICAAWGTDPDVDTAHASADLHIDNADAGVA